MGEGSVHEPRPPVSRRQVIRRGMVAGGVALWSAPVVAAAAFSRNDARDAADRIRAQMGQVTSGCQAGGSPAEAVSEAPVVAQQESPAAPATRRAPASPSSAVGRTSPAARAGRVRLFCDVDAPRRLRVPHDACCSDLATCNPGNGNGDCAAGYFCIPSSCCGVPQVHAPVRHPPARRPHRQPVQPVPAAHQLHPAPGHAERLLARAGPRRRRGDDCGSSSS